MRLKQSLNKNCIVCGNAFVAGHILNRFCSKPCWNAAQAKYKRERYAAGKTDSYYKIPGTRYFPKPCANCGDIYQPSSGKNKYCGKCRQSCLSKGDLVAEMLRSCRSRDATFSLTRSWFEVIWSNQEGKCAVSGIGMSRNRSYGQGNILGVDGTKVSIDRIDNHIGYLPPNCRLVCVAVNVMRNRMTDVDLVEWCRRIVSHSVGHAVFERLA